MLTSVFIIIIITIIELNDLYSSPNTVRVIKWRRMVLVGKPERKRPLGRPSRRWEDNIKMDLQEVGCGVWAGSSWLRIRTGSGHL